MFLQIRVKTDEEILYVISLKDFVDCFYGRDLWKLIATNHALDVMVRFFFRNILIIQPFIQSECQVQVLSFFYL